MRGKREVRDIALCVCVCAYCFVCLGYGSAPAVTMSSLIYVKLSFKMNIWGRRGWRVDSLCLSGPFKKSDVVYLPRVNVRF